MDVVPLSIGVEIDKGKFDVLIPRNTTIPYKATKEYSTVEDNQEDVDIVVYEGERPQTKHNHKLGEFALEGITRAPQGDPTITVTFSVDADGLLTITATEALANKSKSLTVESSEHLSEAEVRQMIEMAAKFQKEDAASLRADDARAALQGQFEELDRLVARLPGGPSAKLQKRLKFVPHGKEWLARKLDQCKDTAELEGKLGKLTKLLEKALKRARKESSRKRPRAGEAGEGGNDSSEEEDSNEDE
ncbi:heat shock protein 70 [Strigomonas culicis]|nr:heat shock protein 70 [Strigomonas culicis]|eukprot:EPY33715.1 heat shock protein 70 [Strigomonas culicis]